MGLWRKHTESWLSSEERDADTAADAAFAHVFTALPASEPSRDFVQRAVETAWRVRARRRRTVAMAGFAASVLVAVTASAMAYGAFGIVGGWLLTTTASGAASALVSVLSAATTAVEWWSAAGRAAGTVTSVIVMPQGVAAIVTIELVGAAALYMLQRLLRAELRLRDPGPLCL